MNKFSIVQSKVAAIFGPKSQTSAVHVHSACDSKDMPHIETQPNIEATVPTINLYPYPHAFGAVFLDLVKAWEWKSFTILYETGDEVFARNRLTKYCNFFFIIFLRALHTNHV
jgi:hypothetical protein